MIEDSDYKVQEIDTVIRSRGWSVEVARSYKAGVAALKAIKPDLVVLDMSIPIFDDVASNVGRGVLNFGGADIIEDIERFGLQCRVIVVTQFRDYPMSGGRRSIVELDRAFRRAPHKLYLGYVVYGSFEDQWKVELNELLNKAAIK